MNPKQDEAHYSQTSENQKEKHPKTVSVGRGHITFRGTISIMTDFSSEAMETTRQ